MDDTHLLKHMKQAILVWSFRQNIFLASLLQKYSISTHGGATVSSALFAIWYQHCYVEKWPLHKTLAVVSISPWMGCDEWDVMLVKPFTGHCTECTVPTAINWCDCWPGPHVTHRQSSSHQTYTLELAWVIQST